MPNSFWQYLTASTETNDPQHDFIIAIEYDICHLHELPMAKSSRQPSTFRWGGF